MHNEQEQLEKRKHSFNSRLPGDPSS